MKSLKQTLAILIVAFAVYGAFSLFRHREPNNEVSEGFRAQLEAEGLVIHDDAQSSGNVSKLFNTFNGVPSLDAPGDVSSSSVPSALRRSTAVDSLDEAPSFSEPAAPYADPYERENAPMFEDAPSFEAPLPEFEQELPDFEAPLFDAIPETPEDSDAPLFDTFSNELPEEASETESTKAAPTPSHGKHLLVSASVFETASEPSQNVGEFAPEPLPDLFSDPPSEQSLVSSSGLSQESSFDMEPDLFAAAPNETASGPALAAPTPLGSSALSSETSGDFSSVPNAPATPTGAAMLASTTTPASGNAFPGSEKDEPFSLDFLADEPIPAEEFPAFTENPVLPASAQATAVGEVVPLPAPSPKENVASPPAVIAATEFESSQVKNSDFLSMDDLQPAISAPTALSSRSLNAPEPSYEPPPRNPGRDPESDVVHPLPPIDAPRLARADVNTTPTAVTAFENNTENHLMNRFGNTVPSPETPGNVHENAYENAQIPDLSQSVSQNSVSQDFESLTHFEANASATQPPPLSPPQVEEKAETVVPGMARSRQKKDTPLVSVTPLAERMAHTAPANTGALEASPSVIAPVSVNTVTGNSDFRNEVAQQITQIKDVLNNGSYRQGHQMLTRLYFSELSPSERKVLIPLANKCGWGEFFSREHFPTDPLYVVRQGDTMESVAAAHEISPALLMKINGITPGNALIPGQNLKVPKGPFHAAISLSRRELVVLAQDLYVCRFRLGIGSLEEIPVGDFNIETKFEGPEYVAPDETQIPNTDPRNPLGSHWIGLGGALGLHGTNDPNCIGTDACKVEGFSFENKDIAEIYDILTEKSIISIRK